MSDYAPPVEGVTTPPDNPHGGVIDARPSGITIDDLPLGGCRNWRIHNAHLAAGDPTCENQR